VPGEYKERLPDAVAANFALIYANHTEWHDVHPLVRDLIAEDSDP
jgi:hypothetical protein